MATLATFQVLSSLQVLKHMGRHTSNSAGSPQHEPRTGSAYRATPGVWTRQSAPGLPVVLCCTPHLVHSLLTHGTLCLQLRKCQPQKQFPLLEKQGSFKKNNNFDKFIRGPISSHKQIHVMHCPFFQLYQKERDFLLLAF